LNTEQVERRRREIIERHGEWTADNFQLVGDVYTIGKDSGASSSRPQRVTQIISDFFGGEFERLRILDLGSLEAAYAVEFAKRGARVVGVELREGNLVKCQFAKEVLGLDNLEFVRDDVRNLSPEKYGTFDVVLASGILYHLDAPDVFHFIENVSKVCTGMAIVDTHVGVAPDEAQTHEGRTYWGWHFTEYAEEPTPEEIEKKPWLAIGNVRSFWLTRPSLFNLMADAGFSSVYECHIPVHVATADRLTLVGVKGRPVSLLTRPGWSESRGGERCAEEPADITPDQKYHLWEKRQGPFEKRLRGLARRLPAPVRKPLRAIVGGITKR
jgi:Methyltransferase domain